MWFAGFAGKLDCQQCGDRGEQSFRGCDGAGELTFTDADGSELRRCPKAQLLEDGMCGIVAWGDRFERDVYPRAGGLLDQSCLYLDAMDLIENARSAGRVYKG